MDQKNVTIITVLVVIAAGAIGYLYYQNNVLKNELESFQTSENQTNTIEPEQSIANNPKTSDEASAWKTYTNKYLGFSIKYPTDAPPTLELNDENNRLTIFGKTPGRVFEVRLQEDIDKSMGVKYGYLGAEVTSTNTILGGIKGYTAISTTGYADMEAKGIPYVEVGAKKGLNFYHLIFYGDATLSKEEKSIIESFSFTK